MMKFLMTAIVAVALLVPTTQASAAWRHRECRYQTLDHHRGWSRDEVRRTILCATKKFNVSTSTALFVADRESHFFAGARNSSSGACGIFQHMPRYWPSRIASTMRGWPRMRPFSTSCYDARANVFAAMFMVRHGGWSPWSM